MANEMDDKLGASPQPKPATKAVEDVPSMAAKKVPADCPYPNPVYRIQGTPKLVAGLVDSDRNVRITKAREERIVGPITKGSWLHCQIEAGLVTVMKD